jgi:hypothetical protein
MRKLFVLLILVLISFSLFAGCTGNNSKNGNVAPIQKEQTKIQTPQITALPTTQATTLSTTQITSIPTTKITTLPTTRITAVPTTRITAVPTNQNNHQTSSNDAVSCPAGKCWVNPYTKKDGTAVKGYCRKC